MPLTKPLRGRLPRRTHMSFKNNWIGHENVKGTVGYPFGVIAHYKMNEDTEGDNAELVENGDFANWTDDNPDDWTVVGEVLTDPEVSEVGHDEGHGGSGTGMCNLYTSDGTQIQMFQSISLVVGRRYTLHLNIDKITSGKVHVIIYDSAWDVVTDGNFTILGINSFSFVATDVTNYLLIEAIYVATDITIDDVSVKLCAVEDSSGNDHDGIAQQDTSAIHAAGKINGAFDFDGAADYIDCGDVGVNGLSVFLIGCWIKTIQSGTNHTILMAGKDEAGKFGFGVILENGKMRVIMADPDDIANYVDESSAKTINDDTWHFLFLTLEGSVLRYYIDGVEDTNSPLAGYATIHASVDSFGIGNSPYLGYFYDGLIDNVTLWNREPSGYEISRQYSEQFRAYRKRRHGGI